MKVLLVHNRYRSAQPSGENAVVDDEAALLAEGGCHVQRLEVESDEIETWSLARKALLPMRVVWSPAGARLVRAAIDRGSPDVVHFHNTFPLLSPASLRAAKASGVPVVLTLHNFRPLCAAGAFIREGRVCELCLHSSAPFAALRYGCYRDSRVASAPLVAMSAVHRTLGTWTDCVDRIIFPSRFVRDKYVAAGWPPEKLVIKHNTARPPAEPRLGPGEGFVVISRLTAEKGIDVLVDAWREAFPDRRETLSIIGSGDDEATLRQRAEGVDGIRFLGRLPAAEAMAILSVSRALVLPSRCFEVFPRTVAEAFAAGVPVVASRIGSLAEIVDDGRTGILVEPESPSALADALARLSSSTELSNRMGEEARRVFDARLAPERTTAALLEIYREAGAPRDERQNGRPAGEKVPVA